MIGRLFGRLHEVDGDHIIVNVAGVGYRLSVPSSVISRLPRAGEEIALFVHTHVREDGMTLFGFLQRKDLTLFQTLMGVSGIGPRLALTIISHFDADDFVVAIMHDDTDRLTQVPGIGKKTAARMLVELKDRLKKIPLLIDTATPAATSVDEGPTIPPSIQSDAMAALMALGFSEGEATAALSTASAEGDELVSAEQLVQRALKILDRQ